MKLPDNISRFLSRHFLDISPEKSRRVKVTNFAEATSVGIIYKEKNESFYVLVKQYVKYLKEEHGIRDILALAYVEDRNVPFWQVHKLEFDYFCKTDLDWRRKPVSLEVDNFVAKSFDILIDLSLEDHAPLMHILAKSKAKFKVGAYHDAKAELFDMMVDLGPNNTFDQYIHKLNHFLTILNKKRDAQPV